MRPSRSLCRVVALAASLESSVAVARERRRGSSNAPMSYDIVPNAVELDQLVLRVERQPNTVQTGHVDWGFRISNVYGIDYRYTTAKGWLSGQLLEHNTLYGYDPVELYGTVYFPSLAQGMVLTVGRFISPPDIEAQLAPNNYLFSHSVMFTFDPYTFTGVQAMVRLNPQWLILGGVHGGNDMALWSNSSQPNGQLMVRWVSKDNNDAFWGGVNSLGSGRFRHEHDDLQMVVATWGHRFDDRLHTMTEVYYTWQFDAALGGSCIDGPVRTYGGGGGCGPIIPGRSDAIGAVNYFQILLSPKNYLSVRNDLLDDAQGQRSGFATTYSSHTIGWVHVQSDLVSLRPEIRYERAYASGVTPYDNGTRRDQLTGAADIIIRF